MRWIDVSIPGKDIMNKHTYLPVLYRVAMILTGSYVIWQNLASVAEWWLWGLSFTMAWLLLLFDVNIRVRQYSGYVGQILTFSVFLALIMAVNATLAIVKYIGALLLIAFLLSEAFLATKVFWERKPNDPDKGVAH